MKYSEYAVDVMFPSNQTVLMWQIVEIIRRMLLDLNQNLWMFNQVLSGYYYTILFSKKEAFPPIKIEQASMNSS